MKQITVYDIAKEANVSVSTVSRVLNGTAPVKTSTRDRVMEIIKKHHFQPNALARSLIKKETGMLGMILPDISNPFFPEVFLGAEKEARDKGYTIFLCNTLGDFEKETEYLNILQEKRVDGILFVGGRINLTKCKAELAQELVDLSSRLPVVLINGHVPRGNLIKVVMDEVKGAELAVQHLIDLGHMDIAFIGGGNNTSTTVQKISAIRSKLEAHGLKLPEDRILYGDFSIPCGKELMSRIIAMTPRPSAALCVNDNIAIGAIKAAAEAGLRIPQDISIVGFDDTPLATSVIPELTTISQSAHQLGQYAVETVHKLIIGEKTRKLTVLEPQLMVRQSTGPKI